MKSSTRLLVTPAAEQDIADIMRYTADTWGTGRAESYETLLWNSFGRLKDFPELGRPSLHVPGERELILEHHIVTYRYDESLDTVTVLRIVNPRRRR